MSDLEAYYTNFASQPSRWSHSDPNLCGCRGGGWFVSDLDTIHACPLHPDATGRGHPDYCPESESATPPEPLPCFGIFDEQRGRAWCVGLFGSEAQALRIAAGRTVRLIPPADLAQCEADVAEGYDDGIPF